MAGKPTGSRVPVRGTIGKRIPLGGTTSSSGAQIGVNLELPDGTIPTLAQLAAILADPSYATDSGGVPATPITWQNITFVPPNVSRLAQSGVWYPPPPDDPEDGLIVPGPAGKAGADGTSGFPLYLEPEQPDDPVTIPGVAGAAGAAGTAGATGPPGYPIVAEPEQPDDPLSIPGVAGAAGATGAAGAVGVPIVVEPEQPDDPLNIPGAQGATGASGSTGATGPPGVMSTQHMFPDEPDEPMVVPGKDASALIQQRGANWSAINGIQVTGALNVPIIIAEDCTILDCTILTEGGTGSCAVDIWATPVASYPPTVANTILNTHESISAGTNLRDTSLTNFNQTTFNKGTAVVFNLVSCSGFTNVTIMLSLQRTGAPFGGGGGYTNAQAVGAVAAALSNAGNVDFTYSGGAISANYADIATVAQNGGEYFPSGNIIMWGTITNASTPPNPIDVTITFPTINSVAGFPNHCWGVVVSSQRSVAANGQAGDGSGFVSGISKTGCTITIDANAVNYVGYWFAWGN